MCEVTAQQSCRRQVAWSFYQLLLCSNHSPPPSPTGALQDVLHISRVFCLTYSKDDSRDRGTQFRHFVRLNCMRHTHIWCENKLHQTESQVYDLTEPYTHVMSAGA